MLHDGAVYATLRRTAVRTEGLTLLALIHLSHVSDNRLVGSRFEQEVVPQPCSQYVVLSCGILGGNDAKREKSKECKITVRAIPPYTLEAGPGNQPSC